MNIRFEAVGDCKVRVTVTLEGGAQHTEVLSAYSSKSLALELEAARFESDWFSPVEGVCRCGVKTKSIVRGRPGRYECKGCNYANTR